MPLRVSCPSASDDDLPNSGPTTLTRFLSTADLVLAETAIWLHPSGSHSHSQSQLCLGYDSDVSGSGQTQVSTSNYDTRPRMSRELRYFEVLSNSDLGFCCCAVFTVWPKLPFKLARLALYSIPKTLLWTIPKTLVWSIPKAIILGILGFGSRGPERGTYPVCFEGTIAHSHRHRQIPGRLTTNALVTAATSLPEAGSPEPSGTEPPHAGTTTSSATATLGSRRSLSTVASGCSCVSLGAVDAFSF